MVEVDGPEANDLADGDSGISERGAVRRRRGTDADDEGGKRKRGGGGGGRKRQKANDGWIHHGEWAWQEDDEFEVRARVHV